MIPRGVSDALARALAKSPADRFRSAAEFVAALDQPDEPQRPPRRRRSVLFTVAISLLALVVVVGMVWLALRRPPVALSPGPVTLRQVTSSQAVEESPALSPDGRRLVFSRDIAGHRQLFLRELPDGPEKQLTQGDYDNIQAIWTPDQRAVLYVRATQP